MTTRRRRFSLPAVVVLTATWMLLWDGLSLFIVLTGIALALLIGLVFPLPAIELHGRIHPVGLFRLAVRLLADVVRSSLTVLVLIFRRAAPPMSAIIRVRLRSRSDLYLTQTAELVSLVPGTIVIEAHRATSTLYLHVLGLTDETSLQQVREDVFAAEARVLRAFGSADELAALDAGRPQPGAQEARP